MKSLNFDLEAFDHRVAAGVERFRVRVAESPVGEQKVADAEEVSLPPDLRARLRQLEQRALPLPELIRLGEDLAAALFPPGVRLFFERSLARLREDEGLRIRLRLETYALADLPWEYAYVRRQDTPAGQKGAEGFLVLNRRLSLVRYEVLGEAPGTLDPVTSGPMRLVALLANPSDPAFPPLRLDREQDDITTAVEDVSGIRVEFYRDATVQDLENALTREAHVFHFAGHGQFVGDLGETYGTMEGAGQLILLGERREAMPFPAQQLALSLAHRGVRLAVLGACQAGRRGGQSAWTGVASALIHAGIPAVVAMQYTITDENAIAFHRRLYSVLAQGQPVDAAVSDGRLAILNRSEPAQRDWGVPVLYLRAEEAVLFPSSAEPQPVVVRTLVQSYQLLKRFPALIGLLGISFPQLLNYRPTELSAFAFALFTFLAVMLLVSGGAIFVEPLLAKRRGVPPQNYGRRTRLRAASALVLTPIVFMLLTMLFHIPNTWPMQVSAGAEARATNLWIKTIPTMVLLRIPSGGVPRVGHLFFPESQYFSTSPVIHRVTISNRSTAPSPPVTVRLILRPPEGQQVPLARVYMTAVAHPATNGWRPLPGLLNSLPSRPDWLPYKGTCPTPPGVQGWWWCVVNPPADERDWREPEFGLPSIPQRTSLEIFLELAFLRGPDARSVPATLVLREAAPGAFQVSKRQEVDLHAGVNRR